MSQLSDRFIHLHQDNLQHMMPLRYAFMTENAFRFYRGSCAIFYEDLGKAAPLPDSPAAWISGDLHLENFGAFRSSNRLVYFDLNDFDEAVLAPALWEVARLTTSIFVAFESLKIDRDQAKRVAERYLRGYAATLAGGKASYIEPKTASGIVCDFLTKASKQSAKKLLKKRTIREHHRLMMEMDSPKHDALDAFLKRELMHHLTDWIIYNPEGPYNYEVQDVVFRVAGTGSVGHERYMFLLKSLKEKADYLLVDMKEARPSSLAPFTPFAQPEWESEAHRIVAVQARMQNMPPALLSPTSFKERPYILQELQPTRDSINFGLIKDRYRDMCEVVDSMAVLTASAQLRSTGRQSSAIADDLIAFGGREDWQEPVLAYAQEYAHRVKEDYRQFKKDWKAGVFGVRGGVADIIA